MNIEKIKKLCDSYVIHLDTDNLNVNGKMNKLINYKFEIEMPNHTFEFKLHFRNDYIVQIQCLSSFKILTVKNGGIFFEEYFQSNNSEGTFFHIVYDDMAVCLFPLTMPNSILTFENSLGIKSLDDEFGEDDQTIFRYEPIDYKNLSIYLGQNPTFFHDLTVISTPTIMSLFEKIVENYHSLTDQIFICLGKPVFPLDFYLQKESWSFIDRELLLNGLKVRRRKVDLKGTPIHEIEMIPENSEEWHSPESFASQLIKEQNCIVLWNKLVNKNVSAPVYFTTLDAYMITKEQVHSHSQNYYKRICSTLTKTEDQKLHYLFQIALFSIFFVTE